MPESVAIYLEEAEKRTQTMDYCPGEFASPSVASVASRY